MENVQSGDRLVADDELGLHSQCPGDTDTLAAATVQLVRIGVEKTHGKSHGLHQLRHPLVDLFLGLEDLVGSDRLTDDLADSLAGIQRGIGILEDQLHILAQCPQLAGTELADVLPLKDDLAAGGFDQPQDGAPCGGLSAAGFAHQTQRPATFQGKADVVHRVQHTAAGLEMLDEVSYLQNGFGHYDFSFRSMWKPGLSYAQQRMKWVSDTYRFSCTCLQASVAYWQRG